MTKALYLRCEEGEIKLNPDLTYNVFDQNMTAKQLAKLNINHLPWLDQTTALQEIENFQKLSILYHPDIVSSLITEEENSIYWGKREHEALIIFRRETVNKSEDDLSESQRKRLIASPYDITANKARVKKHSIIKQLVSLGYHKDSAQSLFDDFMDKNGIGHMNLKAGDIVTLIDEFTLEKN
ncbi:hypothetical protein RI845_13525 [Thalassotalea nanhaiensis]|uniref:Regulatory protein RecX n=1 Tax=Thalassotalea nanhaiensis TaxID=3065648 RepID=A0ABY9TFI0_9GAMM|nr:hypothetical protein RI845_13525 [Colwelliaceae bacterium SQ345]